MYERKRKGIQISSYDILGSYGLIVARDLMTPDKGRIFGTHCISYLGSSPPKNRPITSLISSLMYPSIGLFLGVFIEGFNTINDRVDR